MQLLVRDEAGLLPEAPAAHAAALGLLAQGDPTMREHLLRLLSQPSPATWTLTRVRPPVRDEVQAPAEAPRAIPPLAGLLAHVDPPVWNEVGALAETLSTIPALVGPLAIVDTPVLDQTLGKTETPAALCNGRAARPCGRAGARVVMSCGQSVPRTAHTRRKALRCACPDGASGLSSSSGADCTMDTGKASRPWGCAAGGSIWRGG